MTSHKLKVQVELASGTKQDIAVHVLSTTSVDSLRATLLNSLGDQSAAVSLQYDGADMGLSDILDTVRRALQDGSAPAWEAAGGLYWKVAETAQAVQQCYIGTSKRRVGSCGRGHTAPWHNVIKANHNSVMPRDENGLFILVRWLAWVRFAGHTDVA